MLAFWFDPPHSDWFHGKVLRLSKPHWADVNFVDGKLWMRIKEDNRGKDWVKVVHPDHADQ